MKLDQMFENPSQGVAMGSNMAKKDIGGKASGQMTARALDQLQSGNILSRNLIDALEPYANILSDIMEDPKYRTRFLALVRQMHQDKMKGRELESIEEDINTSVANILIDLIANHEETLRSESPDDVKVEDHKMAIDWYKDCLIDHLKTGKTKWGSPGYGDTAWSDDVHQEMQDAGLLESIKEAYFPSPEVMPGAVEQEDDKETVSYSKTKKQGDAQVTISANADSMQELHDILKLAGITLPKTDKDEPEQEQPEMKPEVEMDDECGCDDEPESAPSVLVKPQLDNPSYSTDKETLINVLKDKLKKSLS